MAKRLRVLVAGCGNMGSSHAKAYQGLEGFELAGLVSRGPEGRQRLAAQLGVADLPLFSDFTQALRQTRPDAVSINTYPDTHAAYALQALEAGAHVFLEKPVAETVADAERVVQEALRRGRKLVVGYILRHHPSWEKFVELARTLGKPLVMRMNLNQQSSGKTWEVHKNLLKSLSPIVDCGVHYVDIMCQMTRSRPIRVHGIGARLSEEIAPRMYNYGQLQVQFEDGSCGWYEAGWGPMLSQTAFFVKDVVGPLGCVSIVSDAEQAASDEVAAHTRTSRLRVHSAALRADGTFARPDELVVLRDEPDHDALCRREQAWFLKAILEDLDLTEHMKDAVNSLRIVLAADASYRTARAVDL